MQPNATLVAGAAIWIAVSTTPLYAADDRPHSRYRCSSTATIEETFDSNVYLQSTTPLAERSSWVTSLGATFEVATGAQTDRALNASYAPSWTIFHSNHLEDFAAHRFSTNARVPVLSAAITAQASAVFVDGSDESIIWTGIGGPPAVGAPAVRDRRDQAVYRAAVRSEWSSGNVTYRPGCTFYWGDFRTEHRATAGYQNFVDRGDLAIGADVLTSLAPKLSTGIGVRYGGQEQARLLEYPEEYDNRYLRLLALLEGPLGRQCSVTLAVGPEFRHYGDRVHAAFADRSLTNLFVDATVTFAPGGSDSIAFAARQFQQMSSSGRGAFDDRNVDLTWRHTFSKHVRASLVLHAYNTEFLRPAARDDWVYTARVQCGLELTERWTLDAAVLLEEGASDLPDLPGRAYTRHTVSLTVRTRL